MLLLYTTKRTHLKIDPMVLFVKRLVYIDSIKVFNLTLQIINCKTCISLYSFEIMLFKTKTIYLAYNLTSYAYHHVVSLN